MFIVVGLLFIVVCCLAVYGYYLYKQLDEEIEELYELFYSNYDFKKEKNKKIGKIIEL